MEYLNRVKNNQRNIEILVMVFYTIYTFIIFFTMERKAWVDWIALCFILGLGTCWGICASKIKSVRIRELWVTLIMQFLFVLYGTRSGDLLEILPVFYGLLICVAFYGYSDFVVLPGCSLAIVLFYHMVVAKSPTYVETEAFYGICPQLISTICVLFFVHFWVKKRTETMEQMYYLMDDLIDAENSKDDFLANISHEIRTPINTICGMSEMAMKETDEKKLREEVFNIQTAGRSLMSFVSDILDFSQLQSGKMDLEEEVYYISSTINDVINMTMAKKQDKHLELIVDCAADIPYCLVGDEKKIRRVIMNLVDNAVKFTNEGCISIKLETRREEYGVNLSVTVKDTGIGMEKESLEKIFTSFSQVDTRRNRQEDGIGLGLAIAKALVQKMGGTIVVQSRIGKGTSVRFVIPQKVEKDRSIVEVDSPEQLNVAVYIDMEHFEMNSIRDEYMQVLRNMECQLKVRSHICRNLQELKRRERSNPFTHIFITLAEYREDTGYFDSLANETKVILVIDPGEEQFITNTKLLRLYKPFYIIPIVTILNGKQDSMGGVKLIHRKRFIAPLARILVVDDNLMNIRVVEGMLKEYQVQVTHALSGREALDVIEAMNFDFVFMDHMMPEMDGVETMHKIREKRGNYYQRVPIVALTANVAPGNREMFLKEGFADFVEKPMEISVLERVLQRNLPEKKLVYLDEQAENREDETEEEKKEPIEIERIEEEKSREQELQIGNLDVKRAMTYCGGRNNYLELLRTCCEEADSNRQLLNRLFAQKDWKNYVIKVHALKSTMKSLGAVSLSEQAKVLESAGKNNQIDTILEGHEDLMEAYCREIEIIAASPEVYPDGMPGGLHWSPQETQNSGGWEMASGGYDERKAANEALAALPVLSEEMFDDKLQALENAAYDMDGEQMLQLITELESFRYGGVSLQDELRPVKRKIEMSDFMSAVDTVSEIRKRLQEGGC